MPLWLNVGRLLIDWSAEGEEDPLIDRLRELVAVVDPVPESVEAGARLAFRAALAVPGAEAGAGAVSTRRLSALTWCVDRTGRS